MKSSHKNINTMYQFLSIGYDCSPAAALRGLGLRTVALPFDWVESNVDALEKCIGDRFAQYHKGLHLNDTKTRVVDSYGFQFPHDYPTVGTQDISGCYEETGKEIVENWMDYYDVVKAKYDRRINRFVTVLLDSRPIIVLCRYSPADVLRIQRILTTAFQKKNIYFVNAYPSIYETPYIININPDVQRWNDSEIWKQGIERMLQKMTARKGYSFLSVFMS
jgi:hypothetical protein